MYRGEDNWLCTKDYSLIILFLGGGGGLTGEKNHFFYEFFSKLSFKYKYLNVSHVTKHHVNNIR